MSFVIQMMDKESCFLNQGTFERVNKINSDHISHIGNPNKHKLHFKVTLSHRLGYGRQDGILQK